MRWGLLLGAAVALLLIFVILPAVAIHVSVVGLLVNAAGLLVAVLIVVAFIAGLTLVVRAALGSQRR